MMEQRTRPIDRPIMPISAAMVVKYEETKSRDHDDQRPQHHGEQRIRLPHAVEVPVVHAVLQIET